MEPREWGIRSKATGRSYLWANTQDDAERLQAGTGQPERYDVVRLVDGRVKKYETREPAPSIPDFAKVPMVEDLGEDAEVIRMFLVLADPYRDKPVPPPMLSAAEIRERAERKACTRWSMFVRHWYWARQRRSGPPNHPK